jgi:uncharacterized membrane protein YczE
VSVSDTGRGHRPHPRLRGGPAARSAWLVFGLFLFAAGVVAMLESRLGLSPWDVLHQGIARHTPLTFGQANIAVGVVVLLVAWSLGGRPGVGTIANSILVGGFISLLTSVQRIETLAHDPLGVRVALLALGIALIGAGSAFYIGARRGAGPRVTWMVVGVGRTRFRLGLVRGAIEVAALAIGIALGGTFGVGTVAFALLVGPVVEGSFALLSWTPLARPVVDLEPVA